MSEFTEVELMAWCYFACAWTSFGAFAVSDKPWTLRDAIGHTIHGANAGMITGFLTFRLVGVTQPWKFIGIACGTSAGWTRKSDLSALLGRLIGK
jgi:hypothetical protein